MGNEADPAPKRIGATAIFAPIVDEFEIASADELNPLLLTLIKDWQAQDPGRTRSNRDGWHSPDNIFERPEEPMRRLCRQITSASRIVLGRYWHEDDLPTRQLTMEGWANVNGKGAFNAIHSHGGFHLSGVYYVQTPPPSRENSGALQFVNAADRFGPHAKLWKKMHPPSYTITPRSGRLLVFPSTLLHWVYPNDEETDRVSIAFNVAMF